jgi:uncharacterized repeat protein (TIGR01451 family)/CSLREA domain-containing protein
MKRQRKLVSSIVIRALSTAGLIAAFALTAQAAPAIKAGELGSAHLQLSDSYSLGLGAAKATGTARALTLGGADFNNDGFPDLVSGYASTEGGFISLYRGNEQAWSPTSPASQALVRSGVFPPGLENIPAIVNLPVAPELLALGDFDRDGNVDLAFAKRGDSTLYFLPGTGAGFASARAIALGAGIDALASGQIDLPDGMTDLAVAVSNAAGASLLSYADRLEGINGKPERSALPAPADALSIGNLDASPMGAVAILSSGQLAILHGRNPHLAAPSFNRLEALSFDFAIQSFALGNFIWDRSGKTELALLKDDGSVHIAARGALDTRSYSVEEVRALRRSRISAKPPSIKLWQPGSDSAWVIAEATAPQMNKASALRAPLLLSARLAGQDADDLLMVDALAQSIKVLTMEGDARKSYAIDSSFAPVAALSLQTSAFVRPSLILLAGADAPIIVPSAPTATFTVTKTADTNDGFCDADCSLREAIGAANANGLTADMVIIPAGTYTLTIANAGGVNEDNNATGDLDVIGETALVGAGAATTIIQAGTNNTNGIDKVLAFSPQCFSGITSSLSDVTVRFGRNTQPESDPLFSFTGGGIDVCNTGAGGFTMTNTTVTENNVTNGYGGGINFDTLASATGTFSIIGSTITNNRTSSAASILKNGGGINLFGDAHNVTISNSTISGNTTTAEGGGVNVRHSNGGAITISGTTISNNTAASRGGGVANTNFGVASLTINNDSVISGNVSQGTLAGNESRGGGVFIGSGANQTTIRETTITGNQASTGAFQGGGGFAAIGGTITAQFNRISVNSAGTAGGSGFHNAGATVTGTRNWWGCNAGPGAAPCDRSANTSGTLGTTPHLVLRHVASPSTIVIGQTSTLTADFLTDSAAGAVAVADLDALIGTAHVINNPVRGSLSAVQTSIQANGTATATFTATTPGAGSSDSVVDAHTQTAPITINQAATSTTITAHTPDPSPINTVVTVNYSVVVNAPGAGTPTGNVTVSDGVNNCVGTVAAGTCNITLTTAGARTLTATYAGDTNFAGSVSAGVPHTVTNLQANLGITKTDGVNSVTPGGSTVYTITASNAGPDSTTATVADTFPGSLTCAWTCVGAGGGTCTGAGAGNINDSVNLPAGASVTYTANCGISASATGSLANTATVTAAVTDPNPANNSATDTNILVPSTDVSITKTNGTTSSTPGGSTTYTIVASNSGPSTATGVTVADTFPAVLSCNTTSVAAGGASGNDSPIAGNINDSGINLPPGSSVTYTAVCGISAGATGSLSNTATVSSATSDPTPGNNSATDTDTLVPSANLGITKTNGTATSIPGGSTTYTITASNAGPSNVIGATVADTFPATLTCTWTCVGAGGGICTAAGAGNINDSVNLPSGGSVTYTASCSISAAATGSLANTATVSSAVIDPNPGNNSVTDTDTLTPTADLAITKTDGSPTAIPGSSTTYTITASNAGPSNVTGATVADTFPATLTCTWSCLGAGGGTCTAAGAGNINDSVNLPAGASTTFTAVCAISGSASGTLANTATVAAPGGVTDPSPGNNSATDSNNLVAGPPSQLEFGQQPVNTAGGATITPSPTVRILDQFGNLTTSTDNVTIVIGTNPVGGTLSGTTTVAAVAGVATFNGLSINTAGSGYTLAASSSGLTGATSTAFNITVGAAAQLAFGQQPTNSTANVAITPAPTVRILDAGGNLTASTANVMVAIGTNPGPGTLGGTLIVAASAGVATFANLTIDTAGNGYTLTAASAGLTDATSSAFNVACAASVVTNGDDSGAGSLRQIMADACAGSTITFAGGVTSVGLTTAQLLINKNLIIDGGAGVTVTRVDGSPDFRIFGVAPGNTATLVSLTMTNGRANVGGVIRNQGNLTIRDAVISGGIVGADGGGIYNDNGILQIFDSTISGNTAANIAGGISNVGFAIAASATIINSSIVDNRAAFTGGIANQGATLSLTNCTIANNEATGADPTGDGGGLANVASGFNTTATLVNCTFAGNRQLSAVSPTADDVYSGNFGFQSTVSVKNTILGGSAATATPNLRVFAGGIITSEGNNLSTDAGAGLLTGPGDLVNTDPLLAPLANHGGPTQTFALLPGSPAINAGTATGAPATDARGIARPQLGTVDIGAYESRGFTLALTGGNNQSAGPGLAFASPLTATVTAIEAGEPVQGGVVTFTPPGAGASASLSPNPAPIGAGGVASSTATANTTVGTYSVAAAANGATPSLSYTLTNAGADLSIDDVTVTETNAGFSNAVFTVTRTNSLTAFSVPYSTTAGTAQAGTDYTATSGTLNFAVGGPLTQTISVPVVGDLIVEATETATLNLGVVTNTVGVTTTTDGSGLLTINDNDSAVVAFNPVSVSQSEAITPMAFTVTLSNPVQSGVTLALNSAFGTATAADFTPIVGGTVTFAPNSSTNQAVNVVINNDALDEDDETFTLTLSGLTAVGSVSLGANVATGTIVDDDLPPVISITSPSQLEGDAGLTPMDFVVSLSAVSGRNVTFTRATADGTATVGNSDYQALAPLLITIPAGQLSNTQTVQIVGDTVFEGNESFNLNLTNIVNATVALPPTIEGTPVGLTGTGTIEDDDQQPTTTTITSDDPDASVVGQPYTVVVNVEAVTTSPLGTVTISDGTDSCGPVTLTTGTAPNSSASCVLTSTTAGAKTLTASYTAASTAFADSSGTTTHQVNAALTAISVVGPARSRINQPTTFTFALSVEMPGAGLPAGTVTLSSGAASCDVTVPTATPSCALTFDALGARTVSAAFVPSDGNFLGSSSSGPGNAQTLVFALSDIAVTKSNAVGTYVPGELLVYTVTVRNLGPDAAANIRILDQIPAGLVDVVWSCDASGGVACPQDGGTGDLDATVSAFPVGGLLNYSFFGNVDGSPPQIANTALVELPADTTIEDPVPGNNSATDVDLLEFLFRNGFEDPIVNAATGSYRLPSLALRTALDATARVVYRLDDASGEVLRVYARVFDDEVQYALAGRGSNGALRLAAWRSFEGEPTLSWTARQVADGWVLENVDL